jgi:small conductance mechanosensitive channel
MAQPGWALAQAPPTAPQRTAAAGLSLWERLRSLSLADVSRWLAEHGFPVAVILVAMFVTLWIANRLHQRLVTLIASYGERGTRAEQENRARTVVGVLHNALRTAVYTIGLLMILDQVGVKTGTLLGGVAVAGLAVAFGTQSLIKDYFTGFLVLLEQQYMIGDVIKIGTITGQVERITLRLTVLRDLDGAVHFIPHGQITVVSNLTHGWSQAVFDLNVPTAEHVERVRNLFRELAAGLRSDPNYGSMLLGEPVMLGVDALGDATFTLKFYIRTLPSKRWEVKRELLRRIKERFQKENIKVSVPA